MSKKAVYGIMLAVLLPLTGYFILKRATDKATVMPRHFIPDSVISVIKNGKQYNDTVWHQLPEIHLTNQLGDTVTWKDLDGKMVLTDFFFTHCPTICPGMTNNMKRLQEGIKSNVKVGTRDAAFIHFLSFSIDPERDSVHQLKKWADRFQIDPRNWWLLTGDRSSIYDLSINHMKLLAQDGGPVDSNFLHTDYFVLIDKNRIIRGYYHGLDTTALARLSEDIIFLSLEKDPKKKSSFLADKLELLAVVFAMAAIGVIGLLFFLKKEKP